MNLCEATQQALREEAQRAGISVEALMEWIELCGLRDQLAAEMRRVEVAMARHRQRHPPRARPMERSHLRLVAARR